MSGTTLVYNNVFLQDCETRSFDQQIQYDESNTDVIYSSWRIQVVSTVVALSSNTPFHPSQTIASFGGNNWKRGSTAAQIETISKFLSQKGKLFYFYNLGLDPGVIGPNQVPEMMLIACGAESFSETIPRAPFEPYASQPWVPASPFIDANNGPKPINVKVEQIFGGKSLRVSFEIEVSRKIYPENFIDEYPPSEPEGVIQPTLNVLSNRWYITESKDANWVTTRTIQGTLRVKDKTVLPHLMRYLTVPSLLHGYQRVSQNFASDPTDLVLKYRIEDRRRHEAPPAPAIEWSGEYVEAAGKHGLHQTAELRIRLTGPPGVDKQELIGVAGRIIKQRFRGIQKDPAEPPKFDGILEGSSVIDVIGEPTIEMRVRFMFAEQPVDEETGEPVDALRLRIARIGEPLQIDGYSPNVWPVPLPYDNQSLAGVLGCYLQNPCSVWHAIPVYEYGIKEAQSQNRPQRVETDIEGYDRDDRLYPAQEPFSVDQVRIDQDEQFGGFPYTFIDIRSRYETESGYVNFPLATTEPVNGRTAVAVKLFAGVTHRVLMIEATRVGRTPTLPVPLVQAIDPNGISETLINSNIELHSPENKPDGYSQEYRALAKFVYALSRPPTTSEKLRLAVSPTDTLASNLRFIPGSELFSTQKVEYRPS